MFCLWHQYKHYLCWWTSDVRTWIDTDVIRFCALLKLATLFSPFVAEWNGNRLGSSRPNLFHLEAEMRISPELYYKMQRKRDKKINWMFILAAVLITNIVRAYFKYSFLLPCHIINRKFHFSFPWNVYSGKCPGQY